MNRSKIGAAIVAAASLVGAGPCEDDESGTIKVLQYNVQGAIRESSSSNPAKPGAADNDDYRFVDVLARRVIAERPHVVALQEICGSQLDRLEKALRGGHAMSVAARSLRPNVDCPGGSAERDDVLGIAILVVGEAKPVSVPNGVRLLCADWQRFGGVRVCTAHVNPLPEPDIPDIAEVVNAWSEKSPVIVAGDFNADPEQDSMSPMYDVEVPGGKSPSEGNFYEADMADAKASSGIRARNGENTWCGGCLEGAPTGVYTRKIDYIFADADHFHAEMSGVVEDTERACGGERCSDHAMFWGEVRLREREPESSDQATDVGLDALVGEWWGTGTVFPDGFPKLTVKADGSAKFCQGDDDCWNGDLEARDEGRYVVTWVSEVPNVEPMKWQLQVLDCGRSEEQCTHNSGPIEIDVKGEHGYVQRFGRPHCTPDHEMFGFCEQ
jgi:endonuclease/exonuclease/phosphatase family metal-dependent hydrolase